MSKKEDIILRFSKGGDSSPLTINEENRTVEMVISTDLAIPEYDWRKDELINTIIPPEAYIVPKNGQAPLLDSHDRYSVESVLGSVRNIRVEGNALIGRAHYGKDEKSDRAFNLIKDGHLTDYSVGAQILEYDYIKDGESKTFFGRTYTGKHKVITSAKIKEVSACPIGADENAKNRSDKQEEATMSENNESVVAVVEPAQVVAPQTVDAEQVKRQAIVEERQRVQEIERLCSELDLDEKFRGEVKDLTVAEVKERALKAVAEKNKGKNVSVNVQVTATAEDKFRSGIQDSILMRMGNLGEVSNERKEIARELGSLSLTEVCREFLRQNGQNPYGHTLDMVGRAIATTDLSNVLGNIANKSLLDAFDKATETYDVWCDTTGNLSNFQIHTKARKGEFPALVEQREGQTLSYGSINDQKETVQLSTYSRGLSLTRQAIINDDLAEFNDLIMEMGESVKATYGDIAYAVLTANANMGDGNALFSVAHANLGTQGIVSETTLGEAIRLMKLQKDIGAVRRLNIQPQFLLSSVKNEGAIEKFFMSNNFITGNTTAQPSANIYYNKYTRVYEPRLDDNDSGDPWFLLGAKGKTVKLFFLNGNQAPFIEQEKSFSTDAISMKVRADVAGMAVTWKGMVRNLGA